jgi:hypothetical protein
MQDKIGIDTKERQHLMNVVFGQNGLTNADTTLMFEERSTMVTEEMKEYPALCQYYDSSCSLLPIVFHEVSEDLFFFFFCLTSPNLIRYKVVDWLDER